MEGYSSFDQDIASCDKLLEAMPTLLHSHDMFHAFHMMTGTGSGISTPMSAAVDDPSHPTTAIFTDDLQILDLPAAMLNSHENYMQHSRLGTSSSNGLSLYCEELSPHDLGELSATWKLHEDFSTREHDSFMSQSIEQVWDTSCQTMNMKADHLELEWCQRETARQAHLLMDAGLPHHLEYGAGSKGLSLVDSPPMHGFSRVVIKNSCMDLSKRLDSSHNNNATQGDVDEGGKRSHGKKLRSRNLFMERRRRQKLNERLNSLRALVPKISKLDQASTLSDAISYVRDLKKQVEEREADITNLQLGSSYTSSTGNKHSQVVEEHQILEMEVAQLEERTYQLRMHCNNSPGVLVQMTRALEALVDFDVFHAHLAVLSHVTLNSVVVKVKAEEELQPEELTRMMALDAVLTFGFQLGPSLLRWIQTLHEKEEEQMFYLEE